MFSVAVLLGVVVAYWIADKVLSFRLAENYVSEIADVFDLNDHLAKAFIYVTFVAIVLFGGMAFSISKRRRLIGITGIFALLVTHSLILWLGTSDQPVDRRGASLQCYVITRDAVRYGNHPGIDPDTGQECRPVTAEILPRLREYEKGHRPQRILEASPTFFDLGTGEAVVWYSKDKDNRIEIFNLMGFHPELGEPLIPVTKEVVEGWKLQRQQEARQAPQKINPDKYAPFDPITGKARVWFWRSAGGDYEFYDRPGYEPVSGEQLALITKEAIAGWHRHIEDKQGSQPSNERPPQPVDPESYPFFDPVTGKARVWYWRSAAGDFEFFDRPGFHPRTGDPLTTISKDVVNEWRQLEQAKQKRAIDDQERVLKEQESLRANNEVMAQCDNLAANPYDTQKPANIPGVHYDDLASHAGEAVEACRRASQLTPNALRFQYQLARAMEFDNPKGALEIHLRIEGRYPAAYDNAGSLLLHQNKLDAALKQFVAGVKRGEPDAMISLADLIRKGKARGDAIELYRRAAELGHEGAQSELQAAQQEESDRQEMRDERRQRVRDIFGGILQNMPRR